MLRWGMMVSTSFRMYIDPHLLSASFQMSCSDRPENDLVCSASSLSSSSESCFAYFLRIKNRVLKSGKSNLIESSIRESNAESKSCLRFVAQMTSTFGRVSNESIFLRSVDKSLRDASWIPLSLEVASESISSINKIQFLNSSQDSKIFASFDSLSP